MQNISKKQNSFFSKVILACPNKSLVFNGIICSPPPTSQVAQNYFVVLLYIDSIQWCDRQRNTAADQE